MPFNFNIIICEKIFETKKNHGYLVKKNHQTTTKSITRFAQRSFPYSEERECTYRLPTRYGYVFSPNKQSAYIGKINISRLPLGIGSRLSWYFIYSAAILSFAVLFSRYHKFNMAKKYFIIYFFPSFDRIINNLRRVSKK